MRSSSLSLGLWLGATALLAGAFVVRHQRGVSLDQARTTAHASAPDPQTRAVFLLQKTLQADLSRSYTAQVQSETRCNGKIMRCTARITHAPRALTVRIVDGDGRGLSAGYNQRWMWRTVSQTTPVQAIAEMSAPPKALAQRRFQLLLKNYNAVWLREETLEGRSLEVVELSPRYPAPGAKGPHRLLDIDPATGLVMRSQCWDANGHPMCRYTVSQVQWYPSDVAAQAAFVAPQTVATASHRQRDPWLAQQMGCDAASAARIRAMTGVLPPRATYLPVGFAPEATAIHRCPFSNRCTAVTRYSDGLNTLTLFAGHPDPQGGVLRSCRYGAGELAVSNHAGICVIAVGDLPMPALQRIADSATVNTPPVNTAP